MFIGFTCAQEHNGQLHGFVSFSTDRVEVQEDSGNVVTTVQLPMIREVGTTGTIIATVQVRTGCAYSTHERRYASELVHSTVLLVLLHKHVLSNHEYCTDTHTVL